MPNAGKSQLVIFNFILNVLDNEIRLEMQIEALYIMKKKIRILSLF